MPGILTNNRGLKTCLIVVACLLLGVLCTQPLSAGEPDTQPTTSSVAPSQPAQQAVQPEQKSTKTKLEPRDLLPSLLHPKPGTGSAATEESLLSRDRADLQRLQRDNTRVNRKMQQLDYTIRKMQSDINRAQRIRRQRY
jgi:hypothetical protein